MVSSFLPGNVAWVKVVTGLLQLQIGPMYFEQILRSTPDQPHDTNKEALHSGTGIFLTFNATLGSSLPSGGTDALAQPFFHQGPVADITSSCCLLGWLHLWPDCVRSTE